MEHVVIVILINQIKEKTEKQVFYNQANEQQAEQLHQSIKVEKTTQQADGPENQ